MSDLPTGTVTFLFTDIEGSSTLAQQFPAELPALLARHHTSLRQAIQAHDGYVFKIIGDAFCAAFHTAGDALKAALDAQRTLQHEAWSPAPIKVRMGLHTGAAQMCGVDVVSGGYEGYSTLARAHRVMSTAYGSQALLSNPTAELVRGELPPDVTLRDLGEHRLKGLLNPEHLWQLVAPELRPDFPPLPSLNAIPNNLPVQLTSFIGREKDIAEVKRLLSVSRLVTLTGSGGAGKTRLSLQIAAEVIDDFRQGAWIVELGALTDPALVPHAVASLLGLREEAGRPVIALLADYLRAKTTLIILDNCEHLIDASAHLAEAVLRAAPGAKILATSREPLSIAGETIYGVPMLSLPDPQHLPPLESLSQYEAVRLFIDRALAAQPSFAVTSLNAPAVAQICCRVDGVPLAIELAAARVRALPVEQIAARLDDRFRLLTGGSRTALPRQQTLRATIDWSHNLLSDLERTLFRRLTVFAGGWTLEAAEQVCHDEEIALSEVLDTLVRLTDKSLVVRDAPSDTRYRMLETIHEYAREQLDESREAKDVRKNHLEYFLSLAERAELELRGAKQQEWRERLNLEHANLRAALEWSLATHDAQSALRLAGSLEKFWSVSSHAAEGRKWLTAALAQDEAQDATPARANALMALGQLAGGQGDYADARFFNEQGLTLWRQLDDKPRLANALSYVGIQNVHDGRYDRARSLFEEGLALARLLGDKYLMARNLRGLARVAGAKQDLNAETYYAESLALDRAIGNVHGIATVLADLAMRAITRQDYAQALARSEEVLALFQTLKDEAWVAWTEGMIGEALHRMGEHKRALTLLCKSLRASQDYGDKPTMIGALWTLGSIVSALGHPSEGAQFLAASEAARSALDIAYTPDEIAVFDHDVNLAREQLGEDDFATAWSAGRALTLEQSVAYALASAEALVPVTPVTPSIPAVTARKTHPAGLSAREVEVLRLIADGLTDAQVAEKLVLSPRTVNAHLQSIYNKIGVNSRIAATRFAVDNGLV